MERVQFTRCPYDASPIGAEVQPGGSTLLSCSTCDAAWEWYRTWLRRVREPDREAVRLARAGREPARAVRGVPVPASEATWRRMTASDA